MQQTIPVKPDVKGFYESRTGSIQYVVSDAITGRSAIIDPVAERCGNGLLLLQCAEDDELLELIED